MKRLLKALLMATIATAVGVGIAFAAAVHSDDGFTAGTGGGLTVGYPGTGNTAGAGDIWFRDSSGGLIYFSTGLTADVINMTEGSDSFYFGTDGDTNEDADYIYFGNGGDQICMQTGADRILMGAGADRIKLGDPGETDSDDIKFGGGNDRIYFDSGNDVIFFGDSSTTTGNAYSHYMGYTDVDRDPPSNGDGSTITVQAPMLILQSFNEQDPAGADYVGASIEIDGQDSGDHTGDVIITLGAGQ